MIQKFRYYVLYLIVLLLLVNCASSKKRKEDIFQSRIAYDTGIAYLQQGKYNEAMDSLLAAKQRDPDNYRIDNALGLVYLAQGKSQAAADMFQEILKHENDPEVRVNLSNAYLQLNQYQNAIDECDRALKDSAYQTPSFAYYNKAMALKKLNREEEAIQSLKDSIKRDPNGDRPYLELAMLQMKYGQIQEALDNLVIAIKNNPAAYEAQFQKALAHLRLKDEAQACKQLDTILNTAPKTHPVRTEAEALFLKVCGK